MKFSLVSLAVLLSAGLVVAAPNPNGWGWGNQYQPSNTCSCPPKPSETKKPQQPPPGKKPPPPPPMNVQQVTQICGNNNSPHCCNSDSGSHNVVWQGFSFSLQCSPIAIGTVGSVQSVCSTTVACCQGNGCTAIAF